LDAKESDSDPFEAIEKVISWEDFMLSITEADQLSQPESFDHLHLVTESFNMLRRYTPEFLNVLQLNAAPAAQRVLDAITVIRGMNARGSRKMPEGAPTTFVKPRWKPLVIVNGSIDPRFYEICALSELKNSLRSGDIWVNGSRQFRNFDEYLLPSEKFAQIKQSNELPIAVNPNCEEYLSKRLHQLEQQLATVSELALANELPNAIITDTGLKITQLETIVPDGAQRLIDQTSALLPRIKITELLMEVDDWTGFTRHFVHLKDGQTPPDRTLLLSAILADAINLGLTKMAESSPGLTYDKLSWLQAWHIPDDA
jgi:Tn3 transposase DDE domain